eukprot:gene8134-11016_t
MPLWVKPTSLIAVEDVMQYMRSHYEQTALDMSGHTFSDVGAGKTRHDVVIMAACPTFLFVLCAGAFSAP